MSDVAAAGARALAASLAVNCSFVAAFAFLAWETLLSLGNEVEFIWSTSLTSPTKYPFLLLRWYSLVVLFILQGSVTGLTFDTRFFRPPHCHAWFAFQAISLQIVIALQQYLMALRVFALYNRNRTLIITLGSLFVLTQLCIAGSEVVIIPNVAFSEYGCHPLRFPDAVIGLGALPLLFDLVLLGLTFNKAARVWRAGGRVPLLSLLVRDGVWAFLAVLAVFHLNGILFHVLPPPLSSLAWPWQYAVCAAAACRVVLRMHTEGGAPVRELMHTTETDLALTTFDSEPERDAEQLRHRSARWGSSVHD